MMNPDRLRVNVNCGPGELSHCDIALVKLNVEVLNGLSRYPGAVAIAFRVLLELIVIAPVYFFVAGDGVVPSKV